MIDHLSELQRRWAASKERRLAQRLRLLAAVLHIISAVLMLWLSVSIDAGGVWLIPSILFLVTGLLNLSAWIIVRRAT